MRAQAVPTTSRNRRKQARLSRLSFCPGSPGIASVGGVFIVRVLMSEPFGVIPELTCLDCGTRAAAEDSGNDAGEDESRDDAAAEDPVQIGFPADDKGK